MISITTTCMNTTGESPSFEEYGDFDLSLLSVDNDESKPIGHLKLERDRSVSPEYIPTTVFETSFPVTQNQQQQSIENHIIAAKQEKIHTTFPPSPTPSVEFNIANGRNSHFNKHLFPPSPPDSSGAPSPVDCHFVWNSMSPSTGSNNSSDWNRAKPSNSEIISFNQMSPQSIEIANEATTKDCHSHSTIRECLQDSSFQRKYNLKPLETSSFDDDNLECLVLEHIPKFIRNTCDTLGISSDPQKWDREQVQVWLRFMLEQYVTSPVPNIQYIFDEDGEQLSRLTQIDFTNRLKDGATLFALLEIWKNTHLHANQINSNSDFLPWNMENAFKVDDYEHEPDDTRRSSQEYVPMDTSSDFSFEMAEMANETNDRDVAQCNQKLNQNTFERYARHQMHTDSPTKDQSNTTTTTATTTGAGAGTTATTTTTTPTPTTGTTAKSPHGRQGSAHIHLWQFLKELLEAPQKHGTAIRWIDRRSGIFKIEDSVRVARLWGQRKNRPAMNYDKLSRSIRQYYKKGIMQKTERSQRLVYQFCSPYISPVHTNI